MLSSSSALVQFSGGVHFACLLLLTPFKGSTHGKFRLKHFGSFEKPWASGILSPNKLHRKRPFLYLQDDYLGSGGLDSQLIGRVSAVAFGCSRAPKSFWGAGKIDCQLI